MRRSASSKNKEYRFLVVDDDRGIIDTVTAYLKRNGYSNDAVMDPFEAIKMVKNNKYDILILDFMMDGLHGDEVVERIRKFNKDLYILLLTGFQDLVPPIETIKQLDIQGYCEKGHNLDQMALLVESAVKSITQKRIISKYKDGLSNILKAVPYIYRINPLKENPIEEIMKNILKGLLNFVSGKKAFVLIDNFEVDNMDKEQMFYKELNDSEIIDEKKSFEKDPLILEISGQARAENRTIIKDRKIVIPLNNEENNVMGILYVEGKPEETFIKLLEIYSIQAVSAIKNAFLHMVINSKNKELGKTYEELKFRYLDTIEALRLTVDAKDSDTRGHSDRVSHNAVLFGKRLGLSEKDLETLRVGGVFHDIGKIGIGDDILLKKGKLNKEEFENIKLHPKRGAHILSAIAMFKDVVPLIMYHHERYDGTGYPYKLVGNDIPYLARIISVVDAYDAMISNRQYRERLDIYKTKEQLINGAGTQFDPDIINEFLDMINDPFEFAKMAAEDESYKISNKLAYK